MKTRTLVVAGVALCGALFVAVIASCAGFLLFSFKNMDAELSPTIDELFAAIENDSLEQIYDTQTNSEFQKSVTRQQFKESGLAIKTRLGALKSKNVAQLHTRQMNANRYADVVYNATFQNGTGTIIARLSKERGRWLIASFRVNSPEFQKDLATGKCPHGGEPHATGARFCPKCGKPLVTEQLAPPTGAETPSGDEKVDLP
jgi:hypothetical protein